MSENFCNVCGRPVLYGERHHDCVRAENIGHGATLYWPIPGRSTPHAALTDEEYMAQRFQEAREWLYRTADDIALACYWRCDQCWERLVEVRGAPYAVLVRKPRGRYYTPNDEYARVHILCALAMNTFYKEMQHD